MPLIQSKAQSAAANIVHHLQGLQGDFESACRKLNSITSEYIGLPDGDLAAFANQLGPVEMQSLIAAHGQQGDALNAIIGGLNAILATIGKPLCNASVDVRPLAEKLASQGREIVFDGEKFIVNQLPQPEPVEPAEE